MQTRRASQATATTLAIILPHPPLPRPQSSQSATSLLSAPSPHTPRSCGSPNLFFTQAPNRRSTDSWNSSNQDADEQESDWKPDHTLLLSRTLDALPAHLLTPFNGPIPPANLLDKIARGVTQAKGPNDWPHSIRATRAKLLELARVKAKEEKALANSIREEEETDVQMLSGKENTPTRTPSQRKPLYRQNSMDFIAHAKVDMKDNENISRLSNRLQRTERIISNPSYHPYPRPRTRSQSKSLNPSTPSSTTLNSSGGNMTESTYANTGSGLGSDPRFSKPKYPNLRRASTLTSSSLSSNTTSSSGAAVDPRVQRIRRSDSCCGEDAMNGKRQALKRAPSFGASSLQSKTKDRKQLGVGRVSPDLSSDEEEKVRNKSAKKPRVGSLKKSVAPAPVAVKSPMPKERTPNAKPTSTPKTAKPSEAKPKSSSNSPSVTPVSPRRSSRNTSTPVDPQPKTRQRANLQRNPSIFGAPLPPPPPSPQETRIPAPAPSFMQKTLRRTKPRSSAFGLARKISFGGLLPPEEGSGAPCSPRLTGGLELGSAFQMN